MADETVTPLQSVTTKFLITDWQSDRTDLPHYCFPAIAQTPDGYLWLGSFGNLSHFDGNRFLIISHVTNEVDRPGDAVSKLFVDHTGALWVGNDSGIARWKDGHWESFTQKQGWPGETVGSFAEDPEGNLYAVADTNILKLKGDHFVTLPGPGDQNSMACWIDNEGQLWANSEHYLGVWREGKWQAVSIGTNRICGVTVSRSGGLWVATAGSIRRLNDGQWVQEYKFPPGFGGEIEALLEDSHGNLWSGGYTKGVLGFMANGTVLRCTVDDGLGNNQTLCLYEDREGQIWIGSNGGGLARLRPRSVENYGAAEGADQEIINSMAEISPGHLLVATHGGGLLPFDLATHRFGPPLLATRTTPLPGGSLLGAGSWVLSVVQDHSGTIWAGTYGDGLFRIQGNNIDQIPINGKGQEMVDALLVDSKNRLWLGTYEGLASLDHGKFTHYGAAEGISEKPIDMIAEDGDGNIWAGRSSGQVFRQEGTRFVEMPDLTNAQSLYADKGGTLWIGYSGGRLVRFNHDSDFVYTQKQGLSQVDLSGLVEDDSGNLWIGSDAGIVRISRQSLDDVAAGRQKHLDCLLLNTADGMRTAVCHGTFQPQEFKSADGCLWFSTLKGLAMVDPQKVAIKPVRTQAVVASVVADKDTVLPVLPGSKDRFTVPPGKKLVEINYAGICLGNSDDVLFQYRCEGLEPQWVDADTERTARFYGLNPGKYTFTVRALNKNQTWSRDVARLDFTVLPFFWQTAWFRVLALLGLVCGVSAMAWAIQNVRNHRREQERTLADERSHSAKMAKAKESLEIALQRFEAVIENAPLIAIHGYDQAGVILHWNAASQALYGHSRAEAVGRRLQDLSGLNGVARAFETLLLHVWTTGKASTPREWTLSNRNGRERRVLSWMFPVSREGSIIEVFCMEMDITDRKDLEEQLRQAQKMQAIGQLAGGVAHDFNNILAAVMLQTELSSQVKNTPEEVREGLKQIHASAERAARLTKQLLTFSRRQVLQPKPMDLNDALANLSAMLRRLLGEHIALKFNYAADSVWVNADAGMMEQIILNLAINARDAMPKGGTLTISTGVVTTDENYARRHAEASAGKFVTVVVSDTGFGMDRATIDRIFEPFFTTKGLGKGTGLGLATVYGIVQQHRGWIEVESAVGQGATFKVFLPACDEAPQETPAPAQQPATAKSETLLVVEDEPPVRQLIVGSLRRYGYHVLEAKDGAEALALWQQYRDQINLLFTDVIMPGGINGSELAARLKAYNHNLKVIYSTGYGPEIAMDDLRLRDDAIYLAKPYGPDKLVATVRECLDSQSALS